MKIKETTSELFVVPTFADQRDSVSGTHVGHAIANIGTLVGGISAPRWDTEEKAADDEGSRRDVIPEDVDFVSLTVSSLSVGCHVVS